MKTILLSEITQRLSRWKFPAGISGVVGIATGGIVPATLVAQQLGTELRIVSVSFRDAANEPRFPAPKILSSAPEGIARWKKILLVDDVWVTGDSWRAARSLLPQNADVLPFVLKGKTDFALINDIEGCVRWPWRTD